MIIIINVHVCNDDNIKMNINDHTSLYLPQLLLLLLQQLWNLLNYQYFYYALSASLGGFYMHYHSVGYGTHLQLEDAQAALKLRAYADVDDEYDDDAYDDDYEIVIIVNDDDDDDFESNNAIDDNDLNYNEA